MKTCRRMCGFLSVVAFVAAIGDPGTAAGSVWVNDGCPAVGAAESGAQCLNATDDDSDGLVNDGCPQIGGNPETVGAESGVDCLNNTDDDGDTKVNDGCPADGAAESGADCLNNTDDDGDTKVNDGCPAVGQCTNATDDDVADDLSVRVNDGCPAVGDAESGAQCLNNTDDDSDTKVNDGCPQAGSAPEAGTQCANSTDDDATDDRGACCATAGNLCFQLTEPECKALGFTFRNYGAPCGADGTCIPTLSEWGVAVMAMLVLTAGTIVIMRRRAAVA